MFKYIIYTVIVVGIIYGIILSYPGMFFKHKYEYNNMTISSHEPLKGDVDSIINKVNEKILHAEFFSPDFKFHFYITKSAGQYSFLTAFKGEGYAYVSPINGNIFLASADFEKKKANCKNCEDLSERELDIIMISAATNEIIRKRLKFLKYISSPEWKQEGKLGLNLYALRLNDHVLLATQGEIFNRIGKLMVEPYKEYDPVLVSIANEYVSYLPTDEERLKGGYESSVSIMTPGSPDILIQSTHKLLDRIYSE